MFHPSTCQHKQNSVMTSGEALADSIIIKKKSKSSFSGVRAPAFSETKELSNFFWMRAAGFQCGKR